MPANTSPKMSPKTLKNVVDAHAGEIVDAQALEAAVAVAVVAIAFLRVGEHLVRLRDFLELLDGAGFLVSIGVVLQRGLAESALDFVGAGGLADAEHFVVVAFGLHSAFHGRADGAARAGTRSVDCGPQIKGQGRSRSQRPCVPSISYRRGIVSALRRQCPQ